MSDVGIGQVLGETGAFLGMGAAAAAADYGVTQLTAKATMYVRMIGMSSDTSGSNLNQDVSGLRSLLKKRNKTAEALAKRAGQSVSAATVASDAAMNLMSEAEMSCAMLSMGFIPVKVQYNPASLTFRTAGGKVRQYQAMGNENMNSMISTDKKTSTYLSVQLIYEHIQLQDAFGSSSLGMNVDDVIGVGKSIITNIKDEYSVKTPVEGWISLLTDKESRQVIFVWNHMFFHGELLSVKANFNMFNKNGNPIRATVELEIQQSNGNSTFASDKQYWNDAFNLVFGS